MTLVAPFRRLSAAQRRVLVACFLGWSLDAFDFFLLVFCISAIAQDFHSPITRVTETLFLTLAFRPVGALLFGALADRFGRRPILLINILTYSALELACAFASSLEALFVLRALFGVAMGGEWGVGAALALESLPQEDRGFFSGLLQEGYAVGYLLASLAFALFFHALGWRGMFALGASPALVAGYVGLRVEESPVWRQRAARKGAPRDLRVSGLRRYLPRFLFLILLMTGFNAFSHGTQDLYPTFLQKSHGYGSHLTGMLGIVLNLGALTGGLTFGALSERWGRKRAIIAAALLAIPMIPMYAFGSSVWVLGAGGFLMQSMVQGAWGVVPAYLAELSPAAVRATFPGLAYQLGNLVTSWDAVLQARLAIRYGYGAVLGGTVLVVALYLAAVTALGRESRGAELGNRE
jgi:SHS family lactate transporter-like MFS transporter